ncbi:HNH endonuclease signature motif containing protein [Rathayibacter sp. Leaf248]|uniref:HNH endonuclease signature motif containing protein n=1 Tax=Rathayibacter sp. Leaf248 TaxID=2876555 RepID=UPI001E5B5FBE|nr:HNH endonuclease signature motif containing protein [Rathayibacter sp. Leaf248]
MAAGIPGRTTAAHRKNRADLKKMTREHNLPCAICGEPIDTTLDWRDPQSFAYDHKKSRIAYPELADDPANGQPSHARCNKNKGAGDQRPGLGDPSEVW